MDVNGLRRKRLRCRSACADAAFETRGLPRPSFVGPRSDTSRRVYGMLEGERLLSVNRRRWRSEACSDTFEASERSVAGKKLSSAQHHPVRGALIFI
jgi:hypothetical protein